jgi:hypothetical protein
MRACARWCGGAFVVVRQYNDDIELCKEDNSDDEANEMEMQEGV